MSVAKRWDTLMIVAIPGVSCPLMPCTHHPSVDEGLVVCWRCRRSFCVDCAVELQSYFFCTDCKKSEARDLLAGTDLLHPRYASLFKRWVAAFIDNIVMAGINMAIGFGAQMIGFALMATVSNNPVIMLAFQCAGMFLGLGASVAYEGWLTSVFKGQTPGKMAMSVRIVTAEGEAMSTQQAWMRAIMKTLLPGCLSCFGALADIAFALGEERASLHDLIAKTRVVEAN